MTGAARKAAAALLVAAGVAGCGQGGPAESVPTLVATVKQYGPVAYRDPIGAIAPDGGHFATAANHVLRLHDLAGDRIRDLPSGLARILHLTWSPDGRLLTEQRDGGGTAGWWVHDVRTGERRPLWPAATVLRATGDSVAADALREIGWSPDGARLAGVERRPGGSLLWVTDTTGSNVMLTSSPAQLSHPLWLPDGRIACLAMENGLQRVSLPCGDIAPRGLERLEAFGPMATSPDGAELYIAIPGDSGFVSLWSWPTGGGAGRLLARFGRDSYGPSVTTDGNLFFKVQDYWTEVATVPADGGSIVRRTNFQAETPSWSPDGESIGVTYGTWRRITDDFRYPDIAQDAGIIPAEGDTPAARPQKIVEASVSEDQGLTWSPNMKWIALHSHQQESDDIWIRPADSPTPLRRISRLGRGAEVGWPRWSPDGRWIIFNGDVVEDGRRSSALWIIGIDQETGDVREPARRVEIGGVDEEVLHAEWLGGSDQIAFSHFSAPDVHTIYRVPRWGGPATLIHRYTSTQRTDGFGTSPDGRWVVFPEPDSAGRLQLARVDVGRGPARHLTSDTTDKTQPSVSPDGRTIAFTIWRYQARFYTIRPGR